MSEGSDLQQLEREAYRTSWSDGIVDLYLGLSLLWIGAAWIWINDLSGLAGMLPAILVVPMLGARKRFVEARQGYVQWRPTRRRWEQRNLGLLLGVGVAMLAAGMAVFFFVSNGSGGTIELAPGIMAWLLAVLSVGLAFLLDARRMLAYAAVLAVGGVIVVALDALPGWPMLAAGTVAASVGAVMLWRFSRRYQGVEPS